MLKSNMPATIAETVFITSDKEAEWLKNGRRMHDGSVVSRHDQRAQKLGAGDAPVRQRGAENSVNPKFGELSF